MALINNGQVLGSGSTDLILNTRGKIYVRVEDRFYELNFKGGGNTGTTVVNNTTVNPEQNLDSFVTKDYLNAALGEYVTKRNWEDVMQTKNALENAQLDGFTESIAPITINTMQMIVGTQNLQFDFINSLTDDTVVPPCLYINESGQLICPKGVIKHYTLFGPESVKPDTRIEYYARWTIEGDDGGNYTILDLEEEDKPYYVYLRVPTTNFSSYTDEFVEQHIDEDPKGQYIGNWFASIESHAIDELEGYAYLLVAIVTGSNAGGRSIGYLNGFTEILPGQITAYVFKTSDGSQYLDFMNKKFMIGDEKTGYMKWDPDNGLQIKGSITVLPGSDLDKMFDTINNRFNSMQGQIDDATQLGEDAMDKFENWASDSNISAVEINGIFDEKRFIESDFEDIDYRAEKKSANSSSSSIYSEYIAYRNAYNEYKSVLDSIETQWNNRGNADFITLTPEFITRWENAITNYYSTRTKILKGLTSIGDNSGLEYLKKALKEGRTDINGGLVLTNLIELGFSLDSDPSSENYYDSFRVMSGINGQMILNDYKDPAIWFGGSMKDRERESDQEDLDNVSLYIKYGNNYAKCTKTGEQRENTIYKWISAKNKEYYYTFSESGGRFIGSLDSEQPLKYLTTQPSGTQYLFSRSISLTLPSTSFTDLNGNNRVLRGTMQTYNTTTTGGTYSAYSINNSTNVTLSGLFHTCFVSSHTNISQSNAINLSGTEIMLHSKDSTSNIIGIIFKIGSSAYYFDFSKSFIPKPIINKGIIYKYTSQGTTTFDVYTYKGSVSFILYGWYGNKQSVYTLTYYNEKPNHLYLISSTGDIQYADNYTIVDYSNDFAKAMFRMDGSGYLADGNISWDANGKLVFGQGTMSIDPKGAIDLGYLHSDKGSFWIGNDNKVMLNISGDTCTINGSIVTKANSYYEGSFISVADSSGTKIADIGSEPLSTDSIPTYLRQTDSVSAFYAKGSIMWGTVTIPDNWEYTLIDRYWCYTDGEIYQINDLNIKYEFCRVSKAITLEIVLRDFDLNSNNDISLYRKTFGVSDSNQSGTITANSLNSSILTGKSIAGMHAYSLVLKLSPGQVRSSMASDSWISIKRGTCEAQITKTSESMQKGTFIRPNGISSVFGKNSKFQWLGAMLPPTEYTDYRDFRDQGGTFIVAVPATSNENSATEVIGLEITGFLDSSGNDEVTPGISINLGNGWHRLKIEGDTLKIAN